MRDGYIAYTTDKHGNKRIETAAYATRDEAARAAFAADPKARSVTTTLAKNGRSIAFGIQFHSRWSLTPQPEPKLASKGTQRP